MSYLPPECIHHLSNLDDPKQFIVDYNEIQELLEPINRQHKKADKSFEIERFWRPVFNDKLYSFEALDYRNYIGITHQVQLILDSYKF